jgi:DNA-binding NarL/FixJ family response regulator
MLVESSDLGNSSIIPSSIIGSSMVLLVSRGDFFSDCLIGALVAKFPQCNIKTVADISELHKPHFDKARLVLFYQITQQELHAGLQILRGKPLVPSVGLVVETVDALDLSYVHQLIEMKMIDGVLPLTLGLDVFMAAVELIIRGGEHFPSALLNQPAERSSASQARLSRDGSPEFRARNQDHVSLTTREIQVLELIRRGMRNKIIAESLALSENTVKVHVRNIYKKMKVQNRIQAASFFDRRADTEFKSRI